MTLKEILEDKTNQVKRTTLDKELPSLVDRIVYKIYRYRDYVIYHVVIPSSKVLSDATYDVILEVKTAGFRKGSANLDDLPLRVFSNCPSFIFGFAHNYWKSNLLCDWLIDKYDKKVTELAPTKPTSDTLERSIYLAVVHIHNDRMDDENIYKTTGKKLDSLREIINNVRTQAQIMAKAKEKIVKDPERPKKPEKTPEAPVTHSVHRRPKGKITKTTKDTKTTKSTKAIHSTKMTKITKTTKTK